MSFKKSGYKDYEKYKALKNRYYQRTAIYDRKIWKDYEIDMIMEHSISDYELSKQLHRSMASIQNKRKREKTKK